MYTFSDIDYGKLRPFVENRVVMQAEYATEIVFKKQESLQRIYSQLLAMAIYTVKPENIATFLGRKLDPRYEGEVGNNYNVRIEGSRIKHTMELVLIKLIMTSLVKYCL